MIDLTGVMAISNKSGLFKKIAQRPDGLIVKPLGDDKTTFVSNRIHDFTPLETITVYTTSSEGVELKEIFNNMKKLEATTKPVSPKASNEELRAYLKRVLPDYDENKVYISDIKKIIKWYTLLDDNQLFNKPEQEGEASPKDVKEITTPNQADQEDALSIDKPK